MGPFLQVLIASIGFGAGAEAVRQYRVVKASRRLRDYVERNSGFWTDRRILEFEYAFVAFWLGIPWTAIVLAVATNGRLGWTFLSMLGYPLGIYLIQFGLNALVNNPELRQGGRKRAKLDG